MNIFDLSFKEFTQYVKKIKYGYIDKNGDTHPDSFTNPCGEYQLQKPNDLVKNQIGICFDIVELYREFLTSKSITCESYFIEYKNNNITETHAFIIEKRKNNLWYECVDNSWANDFHVRGYYDKDLLIKSLYEFANR